MGKNLASRIFWWSFASITVALALGLTGIRVFFPLVEEYRGEVERWAGTQLGQQVAIAELDARWRGLSPEVILRGVTLVEQPIGSLDRLAEVRLNLDLMASLLDGKLIFHDLEVVLDQLTVQRDADGVFSIPEFQAPDMGPGGGGSELALAWLLQQGNLELTIHQLVWTDRQKDQDHPFRNFSVRVHNNQGRHQLTGDFALPPAMGKRLQIAAEVVGDPLNSDQWRGELYLAGNAINLAYWLEGQQREGKSLGSGVVDFELWSQWDGFQLAGLSGQLAASELLLEDATSGQSRMLNELGGSLDWRRLANGWQLVLDELDVNYQGHPWPRSHYGFRTTFAQEGETPSLALTADYLKLDDLTDILLFTGAGSVQITDWIEALQPVGEVEQLQWVLEGDTREFSLQAALQQLSLQSKEKIPGIANLSGQLQLDSHQGRLVLASHDTTFDWPHMFREPLPLGTLAGELQWQREGDGWLIGTAGLQQTGPEVETASVMTLRLPGEGASPQLDLAVDIVRADARHTARYLPVGIMSPKVVEWLDQGIVDGKASQGRLVYHGRAADFPFVDNSGRFEVAFQAADTTISPQPGWPVIEDIDAVVRFAGTRMEIVARSGRIYQTQLGQTRVAIADMLGHPAALEVEGSVQGETPQMLRYLRESPLQADFAYLDMFQIQGPGELQLRLHIPFSGEQEVTVAGQVTVTDGSLLIKPAKLPLEQIAGTFSLSGEGVIADQLQGRLYGHRVEARVATVAQQATLVEASGKLDGTALSAYFGLPLFERQTRGATDWRARVLIPRRDDPQRSQTEIQIETTLQGLALELPQPFAKSAAEERKLTAVFEVPDEEPALAQISYGDLVSALWTLEEAGLSRGQIVLGEQTPVLPPQPGFEVIGRLSRLSISELLALWDQLGVEPGADSGQHPFRSADLIIDQFEIFKQQFSSLQLLATRLSEQWVLDVESDQLTGRLFLSENIASEPLIMELENLQLAALPQAEDEGAPLDIARLPPLQVHSKQFQYDDLNLGEMQFVTRKEPGAYIMERLALSPSAGKANGQGAWRMTESGSVTEMSVTLDSRDAGRTMHALGFADVIKGGEGKVEMTLSWPGGPDQFAVDQLQGRINGRLDKGQLLDVEPGAGRILGLLSVQALPRRLTLDFSDMFTAGFSYDVIKGGYTIADGVATTDNLLMESPAARVEISGQVDLAKRLYDQRVLVTPYAGGTLPVIGALSGLLQPQVAAVILLAQQLFKRPLDKMTQFEYTIEGPWDDPQVRKR